MSRRKTPTASATAALVLPAELTIYTARDVQAQWLAWLGPAGTVADEQAALAQAGDVGEVDGAGVQMLLALDRSLAARGRKLQINQPSGPLQAGCAAAGLTEWLQERCA